MTHSAVSQQIRQLEQWFDCPLFERRAGGVQLTAAGLDLQRRGRLRPAGAPLRRAQAQHPAFRAGRGRAGQFPVQLAHPRLERFEAAHPDIRIRLQTAADAALLNTRRVDALILAGRDWPREWAVTPLLAEATGGLRASLGRPPVASGRRAGRAAAAHQLAARGLAGLGRPRRREAGPASSRPRIRSSGAHAGSGRRRPGRGHRAGRAG